MKKRLVKTLLATMVCVSLAGTTCLASAPSGIISSPSAAGGESTVEGENEVEKAVFKVVVPTKLDFAVDAFEQITTGQQITSGDFVITNKSNLPVTLTVAAKAETAQGVTFVPTAADVTETDTSKNLFFELQIGTATETQEATAALYKDAAGVEIAVSAIYKGTAADVYGATADIVTALEPTSTPSTVTAEMKELKSVAMSYTNLVAKKTIDKSISRISFQLPKAKYVKYYTSATEYSYLFKEMPTGSTNTVGFKFAGKVNSKADWKAKDFKVTTIYTFEGMKSSVTIVSPGYVTETDPTFTASTAGKITVGVGTNLHDIEEITMIEGNFGEQLGWMDILNATDGLFGKATVTNTLITLDADLLKLCTGLETPIEKFDARITYINKYGDEKMAYVKNVITK